MIRITGQAKYRVDFTFEVDMTEEDFNSLPSWKIEDLINGNVGRNEMESAEMDDYDIDELEELEDNEL